MSHRVAAICLAIFPLSSASAVEPLPPTQKWVVDFAESQCAALRGYSPDPAKPLTLALKPSSTGNMMQLFVVEPGPRLTPSQHDVRVTLTTGAEPVDFRTTILRYDDPAKKLQFASLILTREQTELLRNATAISIGGIGYHKSFTLGKMPGVMAALDECITSLQAMWHIGKANAAAVKIPAKPHQALGLYLRDEDYPTLAGDKLQEGEVTFTLLVDETGTVKNCTVEESSGIASLDAVSCGTLINRAKYHPARDADGKPTKSYDLARIEFRLDGLGDGIGVDW